MLNVVNDSSVKLTGREIAKRAQLEYKQTIDALNALYNHGKVQRIGNKFNTRWLRLSTEDRNSEVFKMYEAAFLMMAKKHKKITRGVVGK